MLLPIPKRGEDWEAWAGRLISVMGTEKVTPPLSTLLVEGTTTADLPTPKAQLRGQLALLLRGVGVVDQLYVCRKNAADAFEWGLVV